MDWQDWDWALWTALGALLIVGELFSLDLILLMLATGAFAGAVTGAFTDSFVLQAIVALAVSVSMLAVVRPGLAKRLHNGPEIQIGAEKLIGVQAVAPVVLSSHQPGQIKLDGELWTAQPYDETLVIEAGTLVEVFEIRGATAYVHPLPELGTP
ncbi:MAG: NfeD family protein [Nocardioides sp.]|uniref:NfeD family protein n=1 Tax=Nocardioides sp. TaxID=35761 RepID=UPI003D6BD036